MDIEQALEWASNKISKRLELDIEILLLEALNKDRAWLYGHTDYVLEMQEMAKFKRYINRRARGEPVAYILEHKEFYGLDFCVSKNVLIPRPETEMIVEEVLEKTHKKSNILLIDIGTGSGCIPISILNKRKIKTIAIDISGKALQTARRNARRYKVDKYIKFVKSDLFQNIPKNVFESEYSKIVLTANLPYLSVRMYKENYPGLRFEPKNALVANKNGLEIYNRLFEQIKERWTLFSCPVLLLMEIDPRQKREITKMITKYLTGVEIEIKKDLTGKNRLIILNINKALD